MIVKQLGLSEGAKEVNTTGQKLDEMDPEDEMELTARDATLYRGLVARANYMGQDRSDVQYAVKGYQER